MTPEELQEKQIKLEQVGTEEGRRAFLSRHRETMAAGRATDSSPVRRLVIEGVDRLTAALTHFHETKLAFNGGGRKHSLLPWIDILGGGDSDKQRAEGREIVSYLTMLELLDGIAQRVPFRVVANGIAGRLQDEARFKRFKKESPGLYNYRAEKLRHTSSKRHARYAMNQSMSYADIDDADLQMTAKEKLYIGIKLIELAIDSTGMFTIETLLKGGGKRPAATRTDKFLLCTPETLTWLNTRVDAMQLLFPTIYPMVEEPLPWGPENRGGFRYRLRAKFPLVRRVSKQTRLDIEASVTPVLYDALNNLQNTRWTINTVVLDVMEELRDTFQGGVAKLPSFTPFVMPAKPPTFATMDEEAQRLWRRKASAEIAEERLRQGATTKAMETMRVARDLADYEAIYFPWSLDFRGRVYPLSSYLHPQGEDQCRGLLTFADEKPLGEKGAYWLAIHGANTLDELDGRKASSMTYAERIEWIEGMETKLRQVAKDPLADLWWTETENPFQFLAFADEWVTYLDSGEGEAFLSRLPVLMDGSCNGAQHYAALLRDSSGGASVNLTDSGRPMDLYANVAEAVAAQIQSDAIAGDEMAILWNKLGLTSRKLVKRPVMTYLYGSRQYGFRLQLADVIKKDTKLALRAEGFGTRTIVSMQGGEREIDNLNKACTYFANVLLDSMRVVVASAAEGMEWLQDRARRIASTNGAVEWVVPVTGMLVRQEYVEHVRKQVHTMMHGKLTWPSYWVPTAKVTKRRQVNGVAPNMIHSLDAAHLMLMTNQSVECGVTSLFVIHDSFGTHAGDTEVMRMATRSTFVRLYHDDVAADLEAQLVAQIADTDDLPAMPLKGSLDLSLVLDSPYFFS